MRFPWQGIRKRRYDALRQAVDGLPLEARRAMLAGLRPGRIITGAYAAGGGMCPALAAYRKGARTDFAEFATAWDRYARTGHVRWATRKELSALADLLEASLAAEAAAELDLSEQVEGGGHLRGEQDAEHVEREAPGLVGVS